ncbi:MAG: glycosyltransferase family 2 protein [Candidatus Omnitrophota bacterium]
MNPNIPLTVVVITKNEARQICDCLETIRWAGEIIVLDDESTDATPELARRYTDRVLTRKMELEGSHRNYAYSLATHPWVFSLDADERVTGELQEELIRAVQENSDFVAFSVPRKNYIGETWIRYGGWYPSAQLKLFRKGKFRYEEAEVHPVSYVDGKIGELHSDLLHYSYRDVGDFLNKLNRQTTLEAQKWLRDGRRMGFGKSFWRSFDRFFRAYLGKRGYRDGFLGFIVAYYASLYQMVSYAKYREMKKSSSS